MLYKIFMEESFREDPDLVGFLHARDMDVALAVLSRNIGDTWTDFEGVEVRHMVVIRESEVKDQEEPTDYVGRLVVTSTNEDGDQGRDIYLVRYQADEVCLFHGEDWRQVFTDQ